MTNRAHLSAPRLWAIAMALMLALTLLRAVPAMADPPPPDHFHPEVVNETLAAGESIDVEKELHLSGLPASADIIVAIDTTGSMAGALAAAQADATQICTDVQAAIPGARFAAVEFEDYPIPPYGAPTDTPYLLHTPGYVSDCAAFSAAVNTMLLGNGGDGPESYNRVNFEAYSDPVILASRDPQATQFLVVLGDNVPHSVASLGACPSTAPLSDPGRNGINEGGAGDDLETPDTVAGLTANDIILLMIDYGGFALPCHDAMAGPTGGDAVPAAQADDIGAFIIANAEEVEYTVDLEVSAGCQLGISFSPAPPYGPFTGAQDIDFTETIAAPTTPGDYSCTVTAVLNPGGATAVQTINITVTPGAPATLTLEPQAAINEVGDEHCVTATVEDEFGNPTPGVTVVFDVSGAHTTGGSVVTDDDGQAEFCYTGVNTGPDTIMAFADTNNNGVQDPGEPSNTASKLWFAFAEGGQFVIGDLTPHAPGMTVNWWGAQWHKNNKLSGGAAPAQFKGFENSNATPTCGTDWTTDPGNSSNPPPTVPEFMGVIVSSDINNSGSTISGDVVEIVIVKNNPGYSDNPGHPGTGEVVAVLCRTP